VFAAPEEDGFCFDTVKNKTGRLVPARISQFEEVQVWIGEGEPPRLCLREGL